MRDICSASSGSVSSSTSSSASCAIFSTSSSVTLMRSPSPARGPRRRRAAASCRSPGRRIRRPGDRHEAAARRLRGPRAGLGERMSVTRDGGRKMAQLAELDGDEGTLPLVAEQMSRILDYVAQIGGVAASESARPFVPGPDAARFRPDEVKPWPLAFGPPKLAPAFKDGFFLVPKLGQFEEAGEGE